MFILNKDNNIQLTEPEQREVIKLCALIDIDITGITVLRNKGLTWRDNVACFSMLHPKSVFIAHDASILRLMPHIAHELKHKDQFDRMGRFTYMLAITLGRSVLEKEAYAEEDRVKLELNL